MTVPTLLWWPEKGYGKDLCPSGTADFIYDEDYFETCRKRESTKVGALLVQQRLKFVQEYLPLEFPSDLVDFGVGALSFVNAARCRGYDINRVAVAKLHEQKRYCNVLKEEVLSMTFWDSLEHLLMPEEFVAKVKCMVFVTIPIHANGDAVVTSKHRKPGEHLWHFEERGIINWFREQGFDCIGKNRDEERFGREGIGSFAFTRR